jgi:hypothetical protein
MGNNTANRRSGAAALAAGAAIALAFAFAVAGCSPKPESRPTQGQLRYEPSASTAKASRPPAAGATVLRGECTERLHDISGLLMSYYLLNHRMPQRLDELAALPDAPEGFQPRCPETGQPYGYAPAGLRAPGSDSLLLVYDAVPHGGIRNGIVTAPAKGDQLPATFVKPFTEERFRKYQPVRE